MFCTHDWYRLSGDTILTCQTGTSFSYSSQPLCLLGKFLLTYVLLVKFTLSYFPLLDFEICNEVMHFMVNLKGLYFTDNIKSRD